MQIATNVVLDAVADLEQAIHRRQFALQPVRVSLPATPDDITRYVNDLLTAEERRICDMATD